MSRTFVVGLVVVALTIPATIRAHGGHAHKVMGTVSALTDKHVEVKTTDGKTVAIALDAKTVFRQGKTKVDVTALKVGERVVVEAAGDKAMTAKTVQLAAPAAATPPTSSRSR